MRINRKDHKQFLQDEFKAEIKEFNDKFLSPAFLLLNQTEEMYVAQYITFRDGEMIMKFSNNRNIPRKGEFLYCMLLPSNLRNYREWGKRTYKDLYNERYKGTECVCIWHSPADNKKNSLVGFSKVDLDFANTIMPAPGTILVFAPQRPPIDYIANLYKIVSDTNSKTVSKILDDEYNYTEWEPLLMKPENSSAFVYDQLSVSDTLILQGPPGTGKTYMIAELCQRLCSEGKSVLVTSLTNRALVEIAEKPALSTMLNHGMVMKTNITTDENKELPQLKPIKQIMPIPSALVLSTYYQTSAFASELAVEQCFDYVIMDEASQALFAMFAACKKMGKRNLWVGDIRQLPPIVTLNENRVNRYGYSKMIEGLKLITGNRSFPIYQLTTTYRFGNRAASYTGEFYNGTLIAKSNHIRTAIPSLQKILSPEGGPTLVLTDMKIGELIPKFAIALATYFCGCIITDDKEKAIAILTHQKRTTSALQKSVNQTVGIRKNIIIETVARIQGLTTDITILVIPSTGYIWSLEPSLFNVATSRAREHTIIIADKRIYEEYTMKADVRHFLERLKHDSSIYIPNPEYNKDAYITKVLPDFSNNNLFLN